MIDHHPLASLTSVSIVALVGAELDLFVDLVGAPMGDGLGDGEAAAIAVAVSRNLDLVIDDRKARRIVRERFSQVQTYWTIDILRAQRVVNAVGASLADEYFARAKRFGRIHAPAARSKGRPSPAAPERRITVSITEHYGDSSFAHCAVARGLRRRSLAWARV